MAQLSSYIINMDSTTSFYDIKAEMREYFDSLLVITDSSDFFREGSEYSQYKQFESIWESRVYLDGLFSTYFEEVNNYYSFTDNYAYVTEDKWNELGPTKVQNSTLKGIGPVEFISFFDNGTSSSTQHKLTGSLSGGLFYSDDNGNNWQPGGSDTWISSGCAWAVFHPSNNNIWYAASSSWVQNGGIYRTKNSGSEWELIADKTDLSSWTIVYKLVADPFDEKVLYAATSKGIYKTEDCDEDDPDDIGWTNILNGFIYDLEIKPSFVSASTLYCSNFDDNDNWKIHISTNSGSTWNEMSSQPAILHDPDFSLIDMHLTIEVSKAKPDYLYCAVRDGDPISFYYYDFSIGSSWNFIGSHTESKDYRFGTGHGFGVEQALNGNEIIVSKSTRLRKYYLDGTSSVNLIQIHADVEDVVYHPYNSDEVWVCSHGGTEVTTDAGNFWSPRYDGLGVAEVERLATSYTNPELILVGLYHDGVQLTESDYSSNWNPDWIWISGLGVDGMLPIIDNKNPIHMWGSGQKGLWRYSDDGFSSSEKVSDMGSAFWTTVGVVNKENPSMFFRNKFIFSTEDKEEVYRCPDRGLDDDPTIVNEFISNFNPLYPSSGLINILGMCTPYSNGDYLVLYLFEAVDEDSPRTWHVFRSTNVNEEDANLVDWVELDIPRNTDIWLSAIEFDPQNPDILYIAYKKSSDPNQSEGLIYRIDYTDINDPDIDDITDNLPITTASQDCLAAENGFNNGIYLSTEYGVFYTNDDLFINNEYEWKLVGKDLPHASSRGLEINYVSNTLRNATWGRGVWEIPLPCIRSDNPLIISSNTTWNSYIRLDRDIIIDPGVTLTIESGARVCMPTDSKIIVPRGAKLIVDGGTVTNGCSGFWKGIEVWGSSDEHQFADVNGDYEQGYLELKNGATIENAYNAVTLWKPDDWNSMGGIIIASDALFKNNRRSVEFMSYQNTDPSTGEPVGNVSSFTECEFTVDDDYFATSEFAYHISMWEVDGIKIRGCDFNNDMTTVAQRGYGIYTMDAGYKVNSYCETPISPCPENDVINTTFDGFYAGISALQAGSIYPVYVDDAIFDANGFGVKLSESDYATIINNEFYVADNDVDAGTCEMVFGIGVELLNCNGYAVEQNKFFESPTISGSSFGVLVNYEELYADEHGVEQNEIYNNEYNGLTVGNEAVGINRALDDLNWGLKFLCNQNQNNTYDFYIKDKGIQVLQGSLSEAAGNTFSQNGNNPYSDYNNQANWNILYFYDENQSDEEPLYYNEKVNPRPTENGNNCLSNYGDDDNAQTKGLGLTAAGKATYEQQYTDNLSSYNGTMALYEALKDGGDTEGVVIDIETSWPDEMLELRADLLERSPHLSKEVLYATADNTDVFPDAVIFEILAANPDEMGDEEFLAYLEEKENPLPDYYIDILRGLAGDISYKTILRCQLSDYKRKMVQAVNIIIRNEINDSLYSIDTVRNWLEVQGTLPSQFQLIDSYLQEGNTNSALTVLNSIPSMFDMSQDDSTEYNRYVSLKQLQINLLNQGRNIFLMDSTEKSLLVSISDSSKGVAGIQARNILEFVYGEHYCNCPQLPDSVTHKSYQQPANLINSTDLIELKVFPNPAKSWTVFEYKLPYNDNNVTISIYNTSGQLEHVIHIADIQGQKIWDVRDTKAGMYYYKLQVGDQVKTGSLVITK